MIKMMIQKPLKLKMNKIFNLRVKLILMKKMSNKKMKKPSKMTMKKMKKTNKMHNKSMIFMREMRSILKLQQMNEHI
jgi:hypothetical protein